MKKCLIIGAGSYGQTFSYYLSEEGYEIIGFLDDKPELHGKEVSGIVVLGPIELLFTGDRISKETYIFCPIGNNSLRSNILHRAREKGYSIPCYIHPSVKKSNAVIGTGVYILQGVNIMPFVKIYDYCIISMGSNIAHHSTLETGSFISTGVNIGANIILRKNCFIGIGASVTTGINYIGENALIGSGSVVIRNIEDHHVVAGVPTKTIRIQAPE